MSTTTASEEPELRNGTKPELEPESESPKPEPKPESEPDEATQPEATSTAADPEPEEPKEAPAAADANASISIQSNNEAEEEKSSSDDHRQMAAPQLTRDGEGNRTFTMRELLTELKSDNEGDDNDNSVHATNSPYSEYRLDNEDHQI